MIKVKDLKIRRSFYYSGSNLISLFLKRGEIFQAKVRDAHVAGFEKVEGGMSPVKWVVSRSWKKSWKGNILSRAFGKECSSMTNLEFSICQTLKL